MMTERKTRSDTGTVRLKPRDYAALTWLIDMRGITEPDLGWLLARIDGKEKPLAETSARAVVRRWQALGLAEAHRVLVGEPRLITATTKAAALVGQARVGADGRAQPLVVPAWTQIKHVTACSRVRLAMETELGDHLVEWVSDRELRARDTARLGSKSGLGRPHQADAEVLLADGTRVAVEVELTAKSTRDLDPIVDQAMRDMRWDQVRYFAAPAAARAVLASIERARLGRSPGKHPITVEPLPQNPVLSGLGVVGASVANGKSLTSDNAG